MASLLSFVPFAAQLLLSSQVKHALGLPFAPLNVLWLDDLDLNCYLQVALKLCMDTLGEGLDLSDLIKIELGYRLDLEQDMIKRAFAGKHDLIVACDLFKGRYDLLDLAWEDVHTANDEHVVSAPADTVHTPEGATAAALAFDDARDITCAVTKKRCALLGQGGKDDFSPLAFLKGLQGIRVDDLDDEVVFCDMQAILIAALTGDTGAHDLRKPIDIND